MSHYCTICGHMIPAGSTDCHQQCYLLTTGGTGVPTNSTGLPFDARDAEIASLKFILGSKDTHIASLRSTIVATIEAANKEIAELKAQIDKLKCCGNCKHVFDADEENCHRCCEPKLHKWESVK